MSTMSTSSLTERSPARSSSMSRRRVGSARIWNASGMAIHYYIDICPVNNISLALTADAHAEEGRQLAEGLRRRTNRPAPTVPTRLPSLPDHLEHPLMPIDGQVEPGTDAVAMQQGHHEVAPAPALRDVDLEPEVKTPQRQRPVAIADQVVEGRQQSRPRLERSRFDLVELRKVVRVDVPVAFEADI